MRVISVQVSNAKLGGRETIPASELRNRQYLPSVIDGMPRQLLRRHYHRRVHNALLNIVQSARSISEKDFRRVDDIMAECDRVCRTADAERIIAECAARGKRPELCAERVFDEVMTAK